MTEEFIGKIVNVNLEKKQIVLNDKDGILQMFTYPEALDIVMQKQKPGWYKKLTFDDKKVVKTIEYADNPTYGGKASQKSYQKNEGYILFESVFKTRTDLFIETADTSEPTDFDKICEKILAGIERDYPRILKLVKDGEVK